MGRVQSEVKHRQKQPESRKIAEKQPNPWHNSHAVGKTGHFTGIHAPRQKFMAGNLRHRNFTE
jgi:hypothetical protein